MFSASSLPYELLENAIRGNVEAMYWLGYCYFHGINGIDDECKAEKWLRKVIESGHEEARKLIDGFFTCVTDTIETEKVTIL